MTQDELMNLMQANNGEIRIMPARYGGGWVIAGCAFCEWEFDEQWADLVGGDNDYFAAREFFETHDDIVFIGNSRQPRVSLFVCLEKLMEQA